jgi:hypothetical protein
LNEQLPAISRKQTDERKSKQLQPIKLRSDPNKRTRAMDELVLG